MDQDVGSSVITHIFVNTPASYAWGLKPMPANFQVIYTSNGRTGGTITLLGESINIASIIKIQLFLHQNDLSLEHETLRTLSLY